MKHTGHHWDKDYVEPALVHEEHGE
jgi:hypothetical protein